MGDLIQFPTQQVRQLAEWDRLVDKMFTGWDLPEDVRDYARGWLKEAWRKYATNSEFTFRINVPMQVSAAERSQLTEAIKTEFERFASQGQERFNQMLLDLLTKELELYVSRKREAGEGGPTE